MCSCSTTSEYGRYAARPTKTLDPSQCSRLRLGVQVEGAPVHICYVEIVLGFGLTQSYQQLVLWTNTAVFPEHRRTAGRRASVRDLELSGGYAGPRIRRPRQTLRFGCHRCVSAPIATSERWQRRCGTRGRQRSTICPRSVGRSPVRPTGLLLSRILEAQSREVGVMRQGSKVQCDRASVANGRVTRCMHLRLQERAGQLPAE